MLGRETTAENAPTHNMDLCGTFCTTLALKVQQTFVKTFGLLGNFLDIFAFAIFGQFQQFSHRTK